ncbi:ABC transporter substrate-binding protein [Geodermatophilus sp. DSM 44513]|uniref:ABC transporter substrate-binding protein n=1 Tax=Geodermatophilus sp. DSM 44513 TaxID=1528104 RepID=UPI001276FA1D|nr:ABC transporter substrate-binding protein [Geodermatophilus sp. DSM 44513]WNV77620.1 ABC transporter substrate-binding protein [Geodermatophilus sp. DSM 44513]
MPPLRPTAPIAVLGAVVLSACGTPSVPTSAAEEAPATVQITDDFDRVVEVPTGPDRVAVMEWEGLVSKTLAILGEDNTIVAVDPATKDDPTRQVMVDGIADAVEVGSAWSGINYEELASLDTDVVFLEAWVASDEDRTLHEEAVQTIEDLGIPVVVFLSPSNFDEPSMDTAYSIVDTVGTVYERSSDTDRIVENLRSGIDEVLTRIPDDAPAPSVALFATTAYLMGEKSLQSHLFSTLLGARNVAGPGTFVPISEEQLLAHDPDVLVVIGHEGYLSTQEVYAGANIGLDWNKLRDLRAIRDQRVTALGYDEWRATLETPVALMKVGAALYPDAFADVDLAAWEQEFYQGAFGLDADAAAEAIEGQRYRADLGS